MHACAVDRDLALIAKYAVKDMTSVDICQVLQRDKDLPSLLMLSW